jgi:hypothetical protein
MKLKIGEVLIRDLGMSIGKDLMRIRIKRIHAILFGLRQATDREGATIAAAVALIVDSDMMKHPSMAKERKTLEDLLQEDFELS